MQRLDAIDETSYLSVPNAPVYRKIMRCFYREYEKMHFQLYREDLYELLKNEEEFTDYTIQQLDLDLAALVKWKNLTPIQDPGRVYTIADYKNKQYRYTMSEYAVEIERLTVRLENIFLESGSLSTNFFVRLEKSLEDVERMEHAGLKEVNEWWNLLQEDFKRPNQNYQDYLRDFYSGKADRLMKSVEFVLHKDKFIRYLNEFVQELQHHSRRIEQLLRRSREQMGAVVLERVVQSELDIPHAVLEFRSNAEPTIRENVTGKWNSLLRWFLDSEQQECEAKRVLCITNEVIRNIIQNAALIVQMQNWGISRKEDYRKFLDLFLECENLEEAHRLSAHVFGIQQVRHFRTNAPRESDAINESVYREEPVEYLLKPHTRSYRGKKDRTGFADRTMEKMIQREQYLRLASQQKEIVLRYIKDRKIVFSEITDIVTESTRNIFLQWIAQAHMNSEQKGRTEYGQEYRLIRGEGSCVLRCEDGNLTMPAYIMEFDNGYG
ncbi:TIGR02677 family protein [Lacrimispora saccharolytica]|nr:TIGR02677 family protein [Lacrimispora saccharolytica]